MMSQKPRAAAKQTEAGPTPVAESTETIAESGTAVAGATAEVMAETAEAVNGTTTMATENVPAVQAEVAQTPVAIAVSEATAEVMAETAEAVNETTTMAIETVTTVQAEAAQTSVAIETTKPSIKPTMEERLKHLVEEFVALSGGNLEAFVKSGQIWSAGMQELTKQIAAAGKASFDECVSTFKALSTVKSLKEAIDLQASFTTVAIEKMIEETKQIAEGSIKLTEQTLAPITARVSLAVETFNKAA